jgi:hypothetical protein
MRLKTSVSKNSTSVYIIKSTYEGGRRSSKIVEKLGTIEQIKAKHPDCDPWDWARGRLAELNEAEAVGRTEVVMRLSPVKAIVKDDLRSFGGGYLFLQRIYYDLGLDKICDSIKDEYRFSFDLKEVLSRLVYGRVLYPTSKLATFRFSSTLIEPAAFELHHVYRALGVIAEKCDFIQAELYKNSKRISKRNDAVLYYDCTNFFFEIEQEDGLRQYGASKEHRPNPIVQMGLFMDAGGVPLAFCLNPGNTNEQVTLVPLEKRIIKDFAHARFIVCTDAGLSSVANRRFNSASKRSFITTQSIKQLKNYLKGWALDTSGWHLKGTDAVFDITKIDEAAHKDSTFYKERWINDDGLKQRLIVTYSVKYKDYQQQIRARQVKRACRLIDSNPKKVGAPRQNDFKRLISKTQVTSDGEIAERTVLAIDAAKIAEEERYDGFYGVCTNLEDAATEIAAINKRRWEIEECFRIMKEEFKARPAYLSRDNRIKAHFATCFIARIIYRLLEVKLGGRYTASEIIDGLRSMDFLKVKGEGWIPTYTRTDFTDDLHEAFGFRTDYQIVTTAQMRKNIRATKR